MMTEFEEQLIGATVCVASLMVLAWVLFVR